MGLAGIRVGYALAHREVVKVMLKAREPFPVNRAAQAGALASMEDTEFIQQTLELVGFKQHKTYTPLASLQDGGAAHDEAFEPGRWLLGIGDHDWNQFPNARILVS